MLDWPALEWFGILFKIMDDGSHPWKFGGTENTCFKSSSGDADVQLRFGAIVLEQKF